MSFDEILKLKKKAKTEEHKSFYVPFLIVGKDLHALSLYQQVTKDKDKDKPELKKTLLFPSTVKNLKDLSWYGPSTIRNENIEIFKKLNELNDDQCRTTSAVFFKEGKFHEFGGRSKPGELIYSESYYVNEGLIYDENQLLSMTEEEFQTVLSDTHQSGIKSITIEEPTDLVEPVNYTVELFDGLEIKTKTLVWGLMPHELLELVKDKSKIDRGLIEYFQSLKTPAQVCVEYDLSGVKDSEVIKDLPMDKTWFLPLSQTHEWGHFIGDIFEVDNKTTLRLVHFFDEKENNEEDVAKKIRLLRRLLEKIFNVNKNFFEENFVRVSETSCCQKIDDKEYKSLEKPLENVQFISHSSPFDENSERKESFEDSFFVSGYTTRALIHTRLASQKLM
ncbi:MAG: hypothetical protein ACPGJV_08235 [Bacteriovoracaceae bacterium]